MESEGVGGLKVEGVGGGGGRVGDGGGGEGSETVGIVVRMMDSDQQQQQQKHSLVMVRGGLMKKMKRERGGSTAKERISKMPPSTAGKRSSIYRGVTRHRWTGRYEAHLWDKSTWNQNQNKKGKQVYLGAYDDEEAAARAYDLAALKYWGPGTLINFPASDYSRDLEEMQSISREDYLASLRRKSSGFSRGLAKYRGLSSGRWEPSLGRTAGADYLLQYGDDAAAESGYAAGFRIERKIDLTGYIKWWGQNKAHQPVSVSKSIKQASAEDIGGELRSLEWEVMTTEPYQMPRLGAYREGKRDKNSLVTSALSILSRSAAYKNMQEKVSKTEETAVAYNEKNENKIECWKGVEKSTSHDDGGMERLGGAAAATFGLEGLPLHKNVFPLSPLLSAPLLTNYNTIDALADPVLWSSLAPVLPTGPAQSAEVTKTEISSAYTLFQQEEG